MPHARRVSHVEGCRLAAEAGLAQLLSTGSALEAAQRAVEVLEDDARFNAGTGACLTESGHLRLDASIMEGTTLRAGAVAALPALTHPIRVARAALEDGKHLLYAGDGALEFARAHGIEPADERAMITDAARAKLRDVLAGRGHGGWAGDTVGAVAIDAAGRLAAASSTGGRVGKHDARVGDTPIIGAGIYADDLAAAASVTGDGEACIRLGVARMAVELARAGAPAPEASRAVIAALGARLGAEAGVILIDARGRVGHAFNTKTMSHAIARAAEPTIAGC